MLAMMVMAQAAGPWDYTGMHCVLLRHRVPLLVLSGWPFTLTVTQFTQKMITHTSPCAFMLFRIWVKVSEKPSV